jgi:hypothetical protein
VWSPPTWFGGNDSMTFFVDNLYYLNASRISTKVPINFGFYWILNTGESWGLLGSVSTGPTSRRMLVARLTVANGVKA